MWGLARLAASEVGSLTAHDCHWEVKRAPEKLVCDTRANLSSGGGGLGAAGLYAARLHQDQCAAAVWRFLNGTWIAFEIARGKDGIRPDIHLREEQHQTKASPNSL